MTLINIIDFVEGIHSYKFICGEQVISIDRFSKVLDIANEYKYASIKVSLEPNGDTVTALVDMGFEGEYERGDFLDLISELNIKYDKRIG